MALAQADEPLSDDEIFFGKLSLKELKKHILWNKHPPSRITESTSHIKDDHNRSLNIETLTADSADQNISVKIIESHSEPNLASVRDIHSMNSSESGSPGWDAKASDESFLKIENMVTKLCLSPRDNCAELNNTLDVIEYILNNGPDHKAENNDNNDNLHSEAKSPEPSKSTVAGNEITLKCQTPKQSNKLNPTSPDDSTCFVTPAKNELLSTKSDVFITPSIDLNPKYHIFKTPTPLSQKKPSVTSLRRTPGKINAYQHISSPVASYIKNCPQVPLLKDVHPKKPLPGPSSIPKPVKSCSQSRSNKENINLPSVAYRSAKKTQVIKLPDEEKLPQSQWAKKITSSLPKPVVMKHDHREVNIAKKPAIPQEDSFADLSFHQAEVSVCTQKSAFKMKKYY